MDNKKTGCKMRKRTLEIQAPKSGAGSFALPFPNKRFIFSLYYSPISFEVKQEIVTPKFSCGALKVVTRGFLQISMVYKKCRVVRKH